jgi:class 3 adenylate cyclase
MTAQIFACGGTVEKYIGDEILAVWGTRRERRRRSQRPCLRRQDA